MRAIVTRAEDVNTIVITLSVDELRELLFVWGAYLTHSTAPVTPSVHEILRGLRRAMGEALSLDIRTPAQRTYDDDLAVALDEARAVVMSGGGTI